MSLQKRNFIALNIVENVVGHKKVIYIYILKNYMSIKHQKKRDNTFVLNLSVKKRRGKLKIQRGEERHTGVLSLPLCRGRFD